MTQEPYRSAHRVFWTMDNGSSHRGQACIDRMKKHWPTVVPVHTPVHASWLNQVEIYFSILQRKALTPNDFPSLEALEEHCGRLGRDRSEITVTKLVMGVIGRTMEEANQSVDDFVAMKGWPAETADFYRSVATIGDADTFGEEMQKLIDAGLDGVTLNLVPNGHDPEMVALAGESATRAMR